MKNHLSIPKRIHFGFIFASTLAILFFGMTNNVAADTRLQAGTTRYVASSGADTGNCSSPSSPCRTIQYAVNQAGSGDRILVAQGTYTYNATPDFCSFLQTRAVVCIVDKSLSILGGYSTSNWSTANPSANLTVIDGQSSRRGVAVIRSQTTTFLNMEGITIQNARAQGPTYVSPVDPSGIGGGMWVQRASVTLRDMIFRNNQSLGANTGSGAGGAADGAGLRIESSLAGTSSLLQRVRFEGNQSIGGTGPERGGLAIGALFVFGSAVTVEDSTFTNNLAQAGSSTGNGTSGGLNADALGGAIGVIQSSALLNRIVATNNQAIAGNAATNAGGAFGGAIYSESGSSFVINDSIVSGNTARAGNAATGGTAGGGGILTYNTPATIDRVSLIANTATSGNATGGGSTGSSAGGGLYLWRDNPGVNGNSSVTNTIVADNFVTLGSGTVPGGGGGGITVQGLTATILHTTIAGNRLGPSLVSGQGLLVLAAPGGSPNATANLNYSIVANHTIGGNNAAAILVQAGNTINFNRGLFAGNTIDKSILGNQSGQASMLSASSAGFVSPGSPDFNYHLQSNSPARDQATGSSISIDIDGQFRPQNGTSDLGADEVSPPPQPARDSTGVFRPSNGLLYLKNSNTTGFADLALNYGLPGDYPVVGDWDGNGTVTIGIYRNGTFYLRNSNTLGFANLVFAFGAPGDQPIAGDWDGDGDDTIGVYRTSTGQFFLRNSNNTGSAEMSFFLGNAGDVGIAGDWDGDGDDTTGVFRPGNGVIFLKNTNSTGFADIALNYGLPGDKPVMGDWNDDGVDTIGVYRGNTFYLRNSNTVGFAELIFSLGNAGDMPIAGDWDAVP